MHSCVWFFCNAEFDSWDARKFWQRLTLLLTLGAFSPVVQAQLVVRTDRPEATYQAGESVTFQLRSTLSGTADYEIRYDDLSPPIKTGTVTLKAGTMHTINYSSDQPSVVNCIVRQNGLSARAGALIAPFQIDALEAEPADFDAFWEAQRAQLAAVPLDPQLTLLFHRPHSSTYLLSAASVEGKRVYGYLSIPRGEGPFPAMITLPPFGYVANLVTPEDYLAENANVISLTLSIHDAPPNQMDFDAYTPDNILHRNGLYYRYAVLAALRGIDYLHTREDFNGQLGIGGVSQGGGLAVMAAGLDERVDLLINSNPTMSQHAGLKYNRASGFPNYLNIGRGGNYGDDNVLAAVKYYDAIYFARRFKGTSLTVASLLDEVCPPATTLAMYNKLGGNRQLVLSRDLAHAHPDDYWTGRYELIRRLFPASRQTPLGARTTTGYYAEAGPDQEITLDQSLTLLGKTAYNGAENPDWPVSWEKVEGPGEVTFSQTHQRTSTAAFSLPGTYTLRLTAKNTDQLTTQGKIIYLSDELRVRVNPAIDRIRPGAKLDRGEASVDGPFSITVQFTEKVVGLEPSDFQLTNVSITGLSGSADHYQAQLTPLAEGDIVIRLPAGRVEDAAGNTNEASNYLFLKYDDPNYVDSHCSETNNLALQGAARQSSLLFGGAASRAIDGNKNGDFSAHSVTATDMETQPWWEVDLGEVSEITEVHIWNRTDSRTDRLKNFYVLISEVPFTSDELEVLLNQPAIMRYYQSEPAGSPSLIPVQAKGRYLRIQLAYAEHLSLAEVEILGCPVNTAPVDEIRPSVQLYTPSNEVSGSFVVTAQFSEPVDGFALADLDLYNGQASQLSGSRETYQFYITPQEEGLVQIRLSENQVTDGAGNGNRSANLLSVIYRIDQPETDAAGYCLSRGEDAALQWIAGVKLAQLDQESGREGYGDFTGRTLDLQAGQNYPIELVADYAEEILELYWRLWIDWDQNGSFEDDGEVVFSGRAEGLLTGSIRIPPNVKSGVTRMRVAMQPHAYPESCETLNYGEVEDYSIRVFDAGTVGDNLFFSALKSIRAVELHWATNIGPQVSHFEIEHSVDRKHFELIHMETNEEQGGRLKEYQAVHHSPQKGSNYYRLKLHFTDGTFIQTAVEEVSFELDLLAFSVYPNPTPNELFVSVREFHGLKAEMKIYDAYGRVHLLQRLEELPNYPLRFDLSSLDNGMYHIFLIVNNREILAESFLLDRLE